MAAATDMMQQVQAMLQGLQQQQVAMEARIVQMSVDHLAEKDRLNSQLTLAAGKVNALEITVTEAATNLVRLSAMNDTMADERRQSMDVIRSLPAALDKLAESNKQKGGNRALMDNKGLGKPWPLTDDDPDGKFRMWSIRTEDFVAAIYGEEFREIMRWAAEQEGDLTETDKDEHNNLRPGNRLDMAFKGLIKPCREPYKALNDLMRPLRTL